MIRAIILTGFLFFVVSCTNKKATPDTAKQAIAIQEEIKLMADSIEKDISQHGPVAWLKYFEKDSHFFMASSDKLVFPNIDTATVFIKNVLVKNIKKISLRWSELNIEPIDSSYAGIGAYFYEDITYMSGNTKPYNGYFTAIAHRTAEGWKLHNAHWSAEVDSK